jgi:hypothetical protein
MFRVVRLCWAGRTLQDGLNSKHFIVCVCLCGQKIWNYALEVVRGVSDVD